MEDASNLDFRQWANLDPAYLRQLFMCQQSNLKFDEVQQINPPFSGRDTVILEHNNPNVVHTFPLLQREITYADRHAAALVERDNVLATLSMIQDDINLDKLPETLSILSPHLPVDGMDNNHHVENNPTQRQKQTGKKSGNESSKKRKEDGVTSQPNKASKTPRKRQKARDQHGAANVESDGNHCSTRLQLWAKETGEDISSKTCFDPAKKREWYDKGVAYWERVEASVNGVLGGYGHVNERDIAASDRFLLDVFNGMSADFSKSKHLVALDCGAGVGRVTRDLLIRHFHEVDLVEPVPHFLDTAKTNLVTPSPGLSVFGRATNFYCKPLQVFNPEEKRYDVIWVQWCIGHLTDQDFVDFFKRAKAGLKANGFFVVKENTAKQGFIVDKDDSSITRSDTHFRELFQQAGLYLYKTKLQRGFPKELFPVRMYALTTEPMKTDPVANRTRGQVLNHPGIIS